MGLNSVRYLESSGVVWELSENARKNAAPAQKKPADNIAASAATVNVAPGAHKNTFIPAAAPIETSSAITAANNAVDLESLLLAISDFAHPIKPFVKNVALPHFKAGGGGVMILTDFPNASDDESGKILTGAAGELMDKMLSAIGLSREDVSIVPLLFWRTPGGRSATKDELELARPFVMRAVSLLKPDVILTLGTAAASEIADINLVKNHGKVIEHDGFSNIFKNSIADFGIKKNPKILPIYHPNFLILKPSAKRDAWDALQNLRNLLKACEK